LPVPIKERKKELTKTELTPNWILFKNLKDIRNKKFLLILVTYLVSMMDMAMSSAQTSW